MASDPILEQSPEIYRSNVGDVSELEVLAAFRRLGYPAKCWEGQPFDITVLVGDKFLRVQVKTGQYKKGSIHFRPHRKDRSSYQGLIDYFAVYSPYTRDVYIIPILEVGSSERSKLRLDPQMNKSVRAQRQAVDYEFYSYMKKNFPR